MNPKADFEDYNVEETIKEDMDYLWHHILQHKVYDNSEPMIITEGDGLLIKDIRGNEYIDATSGGVWCVNVGYGRASIADAVADQLKRMPYYAGKLGNIPTIKFAKKIVGLLPGLGKVYFSNSGSEANEKAYKIVRQMSHLKKNDKYKILYRNRDYHGTTIGALSSSGQQERKEEYGPFVPGFVEFPHACCYRCHFDKTYPDCDLECARCLEDIVKKEDPDTVGAIIVEPITAGGGIIPPVPEYYPILQEICRKHEIAIIMDEVVCGMGRTGKMFGHEHYDVDPDMVTMAKGLASSYMPLSATAVKQEIYDSFLNDPAEKMAFFRDISTYGGCAGAPAAALESTRIIEDENLVENSRVVGEYLLDTLQELKDLPIVGDVRGKGLFAGIELVADKASKTPLDEAPFGQVMADITAQKVLVGATMRSLPGLNNTINLAPALVATKNDMDRIVGAIKKALEMNSKQ
ncbi:MAG: aminotransferase class III-fold pyridoxal phosphate-dependent enzyme [Proteobacteria bacterium]|nr:aminotransferase class III-fold pyridoxal phosphate-dependent enzyme [Pseudomonadota bacterium]